MRNREPFSLFVPLNVWNLFLATFSTMGAFKLSYEFFETILTHGLQSSYCHVHNYTLGTNGYWVWLFIVSKMFELMDTVFLASSEFLYWLRNILGIEETAITFSSLVLVSLL
ncbi:unnamed protein product [Meloidogyne enterolobii]|uniref:Uncharacterized protein n=1 Tax=Meloidogyne enterolobii TaxID=390850 RepID=A0ACB0ZJS3_MELEN